ncbi:OLC1v1008399C1 [Oldenlandia corymbosa var. corymbosa]|uniref:Eukaryotic translation initiation factor 3 subunit G n=1 Tax=Oldenlandia corymbosa var. corymbosa TaxID=529605 RepID=A0AAV1DN15_OLDCO|nr:OLC1v1008399C1 [Oldenlandia corymbosa var. corymbosa]
MVTETAAKPPRWSDLGEDDEDFDQYLLPPKQVIFPDENGHKKVIEYKVDENNRRIKVTTTSVVRKVCVRANVADRRSWPKFGDAVHEDVGARLTVVSNEEIRLERPKAAGTSQEEEINSGDPNKGGGGVIMVCRVCGKKGDHWSARCPYKDLVPEGGTFVEPSQSNHLPPDGSIPKPAKYVPPIKKEGSERRRNEENSVRVTNLSEDTSEPDLEELFGQFGPVSRVYVARDQKGGGISRGFGFVNFRNKEDAERAIAKLNGYGYDNLILRVEWAAPRTNLSH